MFTLALIIIVVLFLKRKLYDLYQSLLNKLARFMSKLCPNKDIVLGKGRRLPFYGDLFKSKANQLFISIKHEIQKYNQR